MCQLLVGKKVGASIRDNAADKLDWAGDCFAGSADQPESVDRSTRVYESNEAASGSQLNSHFSSDAERRYTNGFWSHFIP
jgi:hypothetical protein